MEWDRDMAKCEEKLRNERKLDAILGEPRYAAEEQSTILDEPQEVENKFRSYLRRLNHDEKSDQNGYTYFDPWDPEIMRSIWFYGYEGSLTEPPCSEFGKCICFCIRVAKISSLIFHLNSHFSAATHATHGRITSILRPIKQSSGELWILQ